MYVVYVYIYIYHMMRCPRHPLWTLCLRPRGIYMYLHTYVCISTIRYIRIYIHISHDAIYCNTYVCICIIHCIRMYIYITHIRVYTVCIYMYVYLYVVYVCIYMWGGYD